MRPQLRVGDLLRQRRRRDTTTGGSATQPGSGTTFSDRATAEIDDPGRPPTGRRLPVQQRVERGHAQADQVRRRRQVRLVGHAARRVEAHRAAAPATRAGPPRGRGPRGRRRPRPAPAASPPPRRARRRADRRSGTAATRRRRTPARPPGRAFQPRGPRGCATAASEASGRPAAVDHGLDRVRRAPDQLVHLGLGLAETAEHVGGDDLGVTRVRAPHTGAHPDEVGATQSLAQGLEPVVSARPPPRRVRTSPKGRSISS